jgi:hypothetical protein
MQLYRITVQSGRPELLIFLMSKQVCKKVEFISLVQKAYIVADWLLMLPVFVVDIQAKTIALFTKQVWSLSAVSTYV